VTIARQAACGFARIANEQKLVPARRREDTPIMLRWRLLLGTLLIAALVVLCWLDHATTALPGAWLLPVAVAAALLGTKETLDLAALAGMRPPCWTVYVGNVLLVMSAWAVALDPSWQTPSLLLLGIMALLVIFGAMSQYEKPGGNMADVAGGVFALVYVGLMLWFAVQLRITWGVGALAAWVIVVKMGDTGAYTVGRLIGRHKMAPSISPSKTIEGAIGALAFACFGSWAAFKWIVPFTTRNPQLHPGFSWGWIVFGLLVGAAGMMGDLAESMLKRDVGVKDSSTWMPGFGGVLDILDSLLLSAPVAWFCWAFGLVG
jgi:phosphatidate cytidylyltransferase